MAFYLVFSSGSAWDRAGSQFWFVFVFYLGVDDACGMCVEDSIGINVLTLEVYVFVWKLMKGRDVNGYLLLVDFFFNLVEFAWKVSI